MISAGTICAGAQLHFERKPAALKCLNCDRTYTLSGELTDCPDCHSARIKVVSGEEFYLESIEVEAESALAPAARDNSARTETLNSMKP
jgi:hydrogenase nickel incorporation protein HypA/HybF